MKRMEFPPFGRAPWRSALLVKGKLTWSIEQYQTMSLCAFLSDLVLPLVRLIEETINYKFASAPRTCSSSGGITNALIQL